MPRGGVGAQAGGGGLARTALLNRPVAPAPAPVEVSLVKRWKLDEFGKELRINGKRLAIYFLAFASLGYLLINSIPTAFLTDYLGGDSIFAVLLAALIGIPVYLNTDGSIPRVATLMQGGMGPGPALAFLVTGAGTSIGAISGMLLIARWRVVALVVGILFIGAITLGYTPPCGSDPPWPERQRNRRQRPALCSGAGRSHVRSRRHRSAVMTAEKVEAACVPHIALHVDARLPHLGSGAPAPRKPHAVVAEKKMSQPLHVLASPAH
ncbi:permease [Streptomyces virginiae]|uniref:permease n=1 Tax=Streptomyces virginiae TaxID=1961 RepID=UPI0036E7C26C